MWIDINHNQLQDSYEMNKVSKEIRSKPYSFYRGKELIEVGYTYVITNPKNGTCHLNSMVHLCHHSQYSWFNVKKLWDRTFN